MNMAGRFAVKFILWLELISFFLQYTFSFAKEFTSVFDLCTTLIDLFLTTQIAFKDKEDKWKLKVIGWMSLVLLFASVINISSFGIGSILTIVRFLLFMLLVTKIEIKKIYVPFMLLLFIVQLVLMRFVDLSLYNTNTVGLVYMTLGVYILLLINPGNKRSWLVSLLITAYIEYQIWLSDSRTCMAAFMLFVVGLMSSKYVLRSKLILVLIMCALTIGSMIYVRTYVYLWENNLVDQDIVKESMDATGKRVFSGRERIWQECLQLLSEKPLTGTGSKIKLKSFVEVNLHNSMLNFFVIYGYVVGVLVMYMIIRTVLDLQPYMRNRRVRNSVVAFMSFLFVAFSETNFVVLSFPSMLCLMNAYTEKKKIERKPAYDNL